MTTYRPGGTRIVAYGAAVVILVVAFVIGAALPENIVFTGAQLSTLALIYVAIAVGLHGIGRSCVRASDAGLEIRNGYSTHTIAWSEIHGISMRPGAPWPTLVHGDDERTMLFALQGSDGPRTKKAVNELVCRIP
ncbi:MAG: PH domain-containing protein [Aeromicrobium sp.]